MEKPAMLYPLAWSEDLSAQELHDVMSRIVAEAAQRHLRPDWLLLGRDNWFDAASLQPTINLPIGVALVGSDRPRFVPRSCRDSVQLWEDVVAFVSFPSCRF